jgi:hypothetical protein
LKIGDTVKRSGGAELGTVKRILGEGEMVIVQVGNPQVAEPTIEWEIAAQAEVISPL